jgi:PD-(D/E)XK nuclease superfamily
MENLKDLNDENDTTIRTIKEEKELPHSELTRSILGCCFEVMKELGPGFLERVYKNALLMAMRQKGLQVEVERSYTRDCNLIYGQSLQMEVRFRKFL